MLTIPTGIAAKNQTTEMPRTTPEMPSTSATSGQRRVDGPGSTGAVGLARTHGAV